MLQGFLVATAFFGGELAGALVELCGHLRGFPGGTAKGDEDLGELGDFHGIKQLGGAAAPPKIQQSKPRSSAALPRITSPHRAEPG